MIDSKWLMAGYAAMVGDLIIKSKESLFKSSSENTVITCQLKLRSAWQPGSLGYFAHVSYLLMIQFQTPHAVSSVVYPTCFQ